MSATDTVKAGPGATEGGVPQSSSESAKVSTRGGLVLPVILIISISLLTTCGLLWTSAQLLNKNAQATTRHLANSMISSESRSLTILVNDYARSDTVFRRVIAGNDGTWAAENLGNFLAEAYDLSTSLVIGPDDRVVAAFVGGLGTELDSFGSLAPGLDRLVERARANAGAKPGSAFGLTKIDGLVHLVAVSTLAAEAAVSASQGRAVLVFTRAFDREFLSGAGDALNLEKLEFFADRPPGAFYAMPLTGINDERLGYLGWRNAWPGDEILWRLAPSLGCALLAMAYVLFIFFRSTDLFLERQAYLVSSLRRERELRDLKTRFVSMVSHELRTPLSTIRSAADLLDRYDDRMTEEERQHELGAIRTSVIRLTKMIENVLAIGRSDSPTTEMSNTRLHLGRFCVDLWEETVDAMEAKHQLILKGSAADKYVHTDETFLRAVLSNLLQNAIKYSPAGQEVAVEIDGDKADCTIKVTDHGPGIPADERDAIFEAFHRGTSAATTSGSGLGLAVAKASADKLGGQIVVSGGPGTGTTFELILPGLLKSRPTKGKRKSHDQDTGS